MVEHGKIDLVPDRTNRSPGVKLKLLIATRVSIGDVGTDEGSVVVDVPSSEVQPAISRTAVRSMRVDRSRIGG